MIKFLINLFRNEFTSERFQGRLYGFCWVLLETRDPNYNPENLADERYESLVLKAFDFATDEEKAVVNTLLEIINRKKNKGNERLMLLGAVEGKKVIYKELPPELLTKDRNL